MEYKFKEEHNEVVNIHDTNNLEFVAATTSFSEPVEIYNCKVAVFDVYATYFLAGLKLIDCEFLTDINFTSGGHNNSPIQVTNCTFHGFLNLEDCWFYEQVEFTNVTFKKGTNIYGNRETPVEITFDRGCVLTNITGKVDIDTFG